MQIKLIFKFQIQKLNYFYLIMTSFQKVRLYQYEPILLIYLQIFLKMQLPFKLLQIYYLNFLYPLLYLKLPFYVIILLVISINFDLLIFQYLSINLLIIHYLKINLQFLILKQPFMLLLMLIIKSKILAYIFTKHESLHLLNKVFLMHPY